MAATRDGDWRFEPIPASDATRGLNLTGLALFRVEGRRLNVPLFLELGRDAKRWEIVCTGLAMGFDPNDPVHVSATALRDIPLQKIIAMIVRTLPDHILPNEVKTRHGGFGGWGGVARLRAHPGGKGLSDEELRDFKQRYLAIRRANPRAPTRTLARELVLTDQAIRYRLQLAERRLGPFRKERPRKMKRGGR